MKFKEENLNEFTFNYSLKNVQKLIDNGKPKFKLPGRIQDLLNNLEIINPYEISFSDNYYFITLNTKSRANKLSKILNSASKYDITDLNFKEGNLILVVFNPEV